MLTGSERGLKPGERLSTVTVLTPAKDTVTPVMSTIRLVCLSCVPCLARLCRHDPRASVYHHCNSVQNITDYVVATNLFEYFEDDELLPCDRF